MQLWKGQKKPIGITERFWAGTNRIAAKLTRHRNNYRAKAYVIFPDGDVESKQLLV